MKIKVPGGRITSTNNIKRVCNYCHVPRPSYTTKIQQGYRVNVWDMDLGMIIDDEEQIQKLVDSIYKDTGVDCAFRRRRGNGVRAGEYDLIIPYATDDEELDYEYYHSSKKEIESRMKQILGDLYD